MDKPNNRIHRNVQVKIKKFIKERETDDFYKTFQKKVNIISGNYILLIKKNFWKVVVPIFLMGMYIITIIEFEC